MKVSIVKNVGNIDGLFTGVGGVIIRESIYLVKTVCGLQSLSFKPVYVRDG